MEINREQLLGVLNLVRPGLSTKEIIEQSNHFILNNEQILTFNDEILVSHNFNIGVKCTVDASLFLKLVEKMKDETIAISMMDGDGMLEIWDNKIHAELPIVKESEIHARIREVMDSIEPSSWSSLSKDFIDGLSLCAFSASTDKTEGTLCCVRVEGEDVMAGSQKRISWYVMEEAVSENFYVEGHLVQELIRFNTLAFYTMSKSWLHFKSESGTTVSVRRVIPMELLAFRDPFEAFGNEGKRIKIPAELREAIDTANLVNEGEQGAHKLVRLKFDKDKIACIGDGKRGRVYSEVDFDKPQPIENPFEVKIRADFLIDILTYAVFMYFSKSHVVFKRQSFQHITGVELI